MWPKTVVGKDICGNGAIEHLSGTVIGGRGAHMQLLTTCLTAVGHCNLKSVIHKGRRTQSTLDDSCTLSFVTGVI